MAFFAYLIHRNISTTIVLARQRADHQLRRMILIEVLLVIIGFIPHGINSTYSLITYNVSNDKDRLIKESFSLINNIKQKKIFILKKKNNQIFY